ncbi:hypothetical protein O1V64_07710 [Rouxiella badensis]|nr:hypothetical protein O1V64_07710 [Rouxiella badensis]
MKKTHKLQGMALSLLTASMLLSFQLHAYDKYDIKKAYPGGEKVTHQGVIINLNGMPTQVKNRMPQ